MSVVLSRPKPSAPAILKISGLRLSLPQTGMRALEAADDVDVSGAATPAIGWIVHGQQRWPVYCLSQDLALLHEMPSERRACVLLDAGEGCVGVLCDDVSMGHEGQRHELPPAMRLPDTPILGLMETEEGIVCLTSAERLAAHLARLAGA